MTICIEKRDFFCTPHTHCETGQFLCHFEQQLTLYKYWLHERVTWEKPNVDRGEKYIVYITFGFKTIQAKWISLTPLIQMFIPFGNPRLIPWPTSRFGCTVIFDLCLRSTFCDALVLFTVRVEKLPLAKIDLKNRKSFMFNVFKQSFICIMHNLYPSFDASRSPQNALFWNNTH